MFGHPPPPVNPGVQTPEHPTQPGGEPRRDRRGVEVVYFLAFTGLIGGLFLIAASVLYLPWFAVGSGGLGPGIFILTIAITIAANSAIALRVVGPRVRPRRDECPRCRYDLRGLPSTARCPECGSRVRHGRHIPR